MAHKSKHLTAIRLAVANVLFVAGVVSLVGGSWLAVEWWQLASALIGGIVLFVVAELIAPFPDPSVHRRRNRVVESLHLGGRGR